MKEGSFVYVDFIGRVKPSGEIFDTTNADDAKEAGIYDPKINYDSVPLIVGARQVIHGLENAIREMNVGERKTIELKSTDSFGERNSDLIKLIPMSVFKQNNIEPSIDRTVKINGINGKILSIDGGRVRVDFNHPLAGKDIEYDIEIKGEMTETGEKIKAVVKYFTNLKYESFKVESNDANTSIFLAIDLPRQIKQSIADTIMKWIAEMKKVSFVDVFGQ